MNLTPPYNITNNLLLTGRQGPGNKLFLKADAKRLTEAGWRVKIRIIHNGKVGFLKRLA